MTPQALVPEGSFRGVVDTKTKVRQRLELDGKQRAGTIDVGDASQNKYGISWWPPELWACREYVSTVGPKTILHRWVRFALRL